MMTIIGDSNANSMVFSLLGSILHSLLCVERAEGSSRRGPDYSALGTPEGDQPEQTWAPAAER